MAVNQNLVIFKNDTAPIIFEILQKYNLNESDEEVFEKFEKDEKLVGEKILKIIENIIFAIDKKENLPILLEEALNIVKPTSEMLALDIVNELLSIARKATSEEILADELAKIEAKKSPITQEEAKNILFIEPSPGKIPDINPPDIIEKDKPLLIEVPIIKTEKPTIKGNPPKQQDSYREPL